MMNFFLPFDPPTVTHQMKKVCVIADRPRFYEPKSLVAARKELGAMLLPFRPKTPLEGAIQLQTVWEYQLKGKHRDGEYKITRPDTDNMVKLLKDVMTQLGFWKDDALVADDRVIKLWGSLPGIHITINQL